MKYLFLISLLLFIFLPDQPSQEGGGFIFRLISDMYNNGFILKSWFYGKIILLIINIFFVYLFSIFIKINFISFIFIISLSFVYTMTYFTFQSYVDPLFFIMLYTLFNVQKLDITNQKLIYLNGFFYASILFGSIIYRGLSI